MLCRLCAPYRGYGIHLTMTELEIASFIGVQWRYTVAWSIHRVGLRSNVIASVAEPVEFTCVDEALDYAEARAPTFVDCMVAAGGATNKALAHRLINRPSF
jgi:hypothetical protein